MRTILLAVGDQTLRGTCQSCLEQMGYGVVLADRPLAVLSLASVVHWDLALMDASPMGKGALDALSLGTSGPKVGIGFEDGRLSTSVPLPLVSATLLSALETLLYAVAADEGAELRLNPARRLASMSGREVYLTRTEFRLLQLLHERRPGDVTLPEVLLSVWGSTEGQGTSELVRAHLRNLRRKLRQIGLTDAVRSRRGRGYALEI